MQMKSNKNGVKLLAAVAVFAMLFAGVAVFTSVDDVDAATPSVTVYISATGDDSKSGADSANALLTLSKALEKNPAKIMLASDYTITGPVTIPAGVELNSSTYKLTLSGTITLNGTLDIDREKFYEDSTNGCKILISSTSQVKLKGTAILSESTVKLNTGATAEVSKLDNPHGFTMNVKTGTVNVAAGYTGMGSQTQITVDKGATVNVTTGAENKGTLIVNGTLNLGAALTNAGTITVNGTIDLGNQAVSNSGTINLNGTVKNNGGTISNTGTINVATGEANTNALGIITTAGITNSGSGKVAGTGWTFSLDSSDKILTLNGYNGKQYFSGDFVKVLVDNDSVITVDISNLDAPTPAILSSAATLTIQGADATKSLTVNFTGGAKLTKSIPAIGVAANNGSSTQHNLTGLGDLNINQLKLTVYADATSSVGNSNMTFAIQANDLTILGGSVVKAYGGNQGINAENSVIVKGNSKLVAAGYEKGLRVWDSKTLTVGYVDDGKKDTSSVEAYLLDGSGLNKNGADDRFGIKVATIVCTVDTVIKTQGLRLTGTINSTAQNDIDGKIYVYGGYDQFYKDENSIMTDGLVFNDVTNNVNVNVVDGESDAKTGFNILDGTATYGKITLKKEGSNDVTQSIMSGGMGTGGGSVTTVSSPQTTVIGGTVTNVVVPNEKHLIIAPGATVGGDITVQSGAVLTVQATVTTNPLNQTISLYNATTGTTTTVLFTNFVGVVDLSVGSTVATVKHWSAGNITLNDGDVLKISGSTYGITGNVAVYGPPSGSATILVEEGKTLSITSGATLTITGNIKMNNDGQIVGGGNITVNSPAQFYTANPVSVTFSGNGKIILEDATETLKLSDKLASSITAEPTQKVIITGNLTIKENQYLIVNGDLEIPEGVTVTIENGGRLVLTSPTASATIAGTIKSLGQYNSTTAGFTVESSVVKDVIITGSIIASKSTDGDKSVDIQGYAYLEGTITVNAKAVASFTNLNVSEDGTVTVKGTIAGKVYNQGTVVIDGAVDATGATIYNRATTAVVQVDGLASGILTVTDQGIYLQTIDSDRYYVDITSSGTSKDAIWADANSITFQNVEGITVTESIKYDYYNSERRAYNHMEIQGSVSVSNTKEGTIVAPIMTISAGVVDVNETLDISKAELIIESVADLKVYGTVNVDDSDMPTGVPDGSKIGITANGDLYVYGLVYVIEENLRNEQKVNAVKYEQKVGTKDVYYYTNLADAIASGVKDLEVLGALTILKDTTIPAGIEINGANSDVTVGSYSNTDVTLTVADGGYLAFKTVDVLGTFVIENTDDGVNKLRNITSDTSVTTETTAMYTNLLNALNSAESGEVRITNSNTGIVTLSADATVKKDVTLVVPTSKTLKITNGVILTIEGTLDLKGTMDDAVALNDLNETANGFYTVTSVPGTPDVLYSVVKVTGTVISAAPMDYGTFAAGNTTGYHIPGAYYEMKGMYYVTTIDQAAPVIKTVDGAQIDIYGENKVGTIAFEGTAMIPAVVNVHGNITAESMTIAFGTITVKDVSEDKLSIDGTFGSSVGSITVKNMKVTGADLKITDTVVTIDDVEVQKALLQGSIATNKTASSSSITFNGKVEISKGNFSVDAKYSGGYGSITVAEDAVVTVSGKTLEATNGSSAKITVNGQLITTASGSVKSKILVVLGTLDIKEAQGSISAGQIAVTNLYIGGTTSDVAAVGAAAAVNAPSNGINVVYQFPGSTVEGTLAVALESEDAVYTEFYVEDVLWLTVYNVGNVSGLNIVKNDGTEDKPVLVYNFVPKTIKEKEFISWQYVSSGKLTDFTKVTAIGAKEKVYANIEYKVYSIGVYACEGIDDVFIDGSIMVYSTIITENGFTGMFSAMVAAGEHTISYTLTNGYSGTATMSVNGDKVTGFKFTTSGDFDEAYIITLQGIEKSGYVPDTPEPTPVEPTEKDDSLGITEYLLIVLVVLAAILVVVVAIRMMRN